MVDGNGATTPWWQSPQILLGVGAFAGGLVAFCTGFHIKLPFTVTEIGLGIGGALAMIGGGFAVARRVWAGLNPKLDAKKITAI
jgi:hypothetical protein